MASALPRVSATERPTEAPERLRKLARNDPDLVRLALRDLRQDLQILVGEELRVGISGMNRLEDRVDRLRLALGGEHHRLPLAFGAEDRALLLALRGQDLGLLDAFGIQDRRPLVAVRPHLLLHRLLDRGRWIDRLQLDPVDADPPLPRRLVEHAAEL